MFLFRIELPPMEMRRSKNPAPVAQITERVPDLAGRLLGTIIL
jgi:hypothetical protein